MNWTVTIATPDGSLVTITADSQDRVLEQVREFLITTPPIHE